MLSGFQGGLGNVVVLGVRGGDVDNVNLGIMHQLQVARGLRAVRAAVIIVTGKAKSFCELNGALGASRADGLQHSILQQGKVRRDCLGDTACGHHTPL